MATPKIHVVRDDDKPAMRLPEPTGTSVDRYESGWRAGKPIEDPEKQKRWGFVAAKPSEYLVCTRNGTIDRKRSGQGMRIFKWPWESAAIVPTTLQRIEFVADQITREKVGVSISGIAVYRIAEPELAFRVLNFSYGEAASEKLAATLREMFVGAARRLVANLTLDDCLSKRKEAIATFLIEEIAPIVSGVGAPTDTTTTGWGVVLDTIEIQQITIQSELVFAHLQAPFRAEIAARAEQAAIETSRATRMLRARTEAEATEVEAREQARKAEMQAVAAKRATELERDRALHAIEIAEQQRRAQAAAETATIAADRERADAAQQTALLDADHARALAWQRQTAELELQRSRQEVELEVRRRAAEARDGELVLEVAQQRRLAELEQMLAQPRLMRDLVAGLPDIAKALAPAVDTLHLTQIGQTGGGPLDAVPAALAQLLALAKSFGLELPKQD